MSYDNLAHINQWIPIEITVDHYKKKSSSMVIKHTQILLTLFYACTIDKVH